MTVLIRVSCSPGLARIAVTRGAELLDYALWMPGCPDGVGDLWAGRIATRMPAMGGAFVSLPGQPDGFLPDKGEQNPLCEGELVAVQVTRAPMGGKGARLRLADEKLSELPSSPGLIRRGPSPLEELACRWNAPILIDNPVFVARVPEKLRDRVQRVKRAFDDETEDQVETLASAEVSLPGGMRASVSPTPALVAIDLDAGSTSGRQQIKQTAQFAANLEALKAVFSQIRLRNLSGAILIDPVGLSTRKRQALRAPVEDLLQQDPLRPRCTGITSLGLIEIVRTRIRSPLHEVLASPHGQAMQALGEIVRSCQPCQTSLPAIRAGADIFQAFQSDKEAEQDMVAWCGKCPHILCDLSLNPLAWKIEK